ncbi:uncharacterized protein LAESUDRAFT_655038 [Laetiporus sulphureus 93-53]|uniref:Uncharacterized protein n=1 Tax=Laetiporus sulphureus 93-53 TaxID=1314785 RepID=A0A165DWN4_9APHY|nr:uncharacterized protein LAESUDRAFT_655038 [Laetiporus sulphureus 93-53]KZT05782.1 hypothetical protein LAESUDRAFT_655038 [Laetiporus sulphureus 93-53]
MPDSYLARVRKLPRAPAPNDRPEDIKGNLSLEMRQLAVNFMRFAIADFPGSDVFGHVFLRDMRLTEIYLRRAAMGGQAELVAEDVSLETLRGVPLEVQLVCELQVRKDMLNLHGVLAGAASAHLIEL